MAYSQFIHGKLLGERSYRVVAMTADLVGQDAELESIAQSYRFWGQQPPVDNPMAVGVFQYQDSLLLAQAMSARHKDGRPALDVQGRPFTQHRYVFLPGDALDGVAGRLWLLLNWVMEKTRGIPIVRRIEPDLPPLPRPQFSPSQLDRAAELAKLDRALGLRNRADQPLLLSTLAALVNGKRVVFDAAADHDVFSEDLLEGALLLLPAVCRNHVSIAAGALDERVCTRARLMVKTNGVPQGPLAADLLWAKRANNELFGALDSRTLRSEYTSLLKPILDHSASHHILLRLLDGVDMAAAAGYDDPWQILSNGWLATRLIPALPDPAERARYWRETLTGLSPEGWALILPSVIDETGLEIAWAELQKATKRRPQQYAPLVFQLWRNFSSAYIDYALRHELPADPALAEALLQHGLLTALESRYRDSLLQLCLAIIAGRAQKNRKQALDLVQTWQTAGGFNSPVEQLAFKEALLPANPNRTELLAFFNREMAPLAPVLTAQTLKDGRFYQQLQQQDPALAQRLLDLVSSRDPVCLPELAAASGMAPARQVDFFAACLAAWRPPFSQARPLLTDLVTQWIAGYDPEARPSLSAILKPLAGWLEAQAPPQLWRLLVGSLEPLTFEQWQILGEALFEGALGQVSFLDHVTLGQPANRMVQQWLLVASEVLAATENFKASYTWHTLQAEGPTWLVEAISQLLGWQEASISDLLPVIERVAAALTLPQPTLIRFLERLPNQGDGSLGMLLAAHLPALIADKDGTVEALSLWQILAAQAPKVAQVYQTLAEGEKNVAVDMFNQLKLTAALNEAPEYAQAMAHWLQQCGKGRWVSGRLLETIIRGWVAAPDSVDVALLTGLLRADLSESYNFNDWLALAEICWRPQYQALWPSGVQPTLTARQRAQVLALAKASVAGYNTPNQTENLLDACRSWGLVQRDLAELIGQVPKNACNFTLVNSYLYVNGALLNPNSPIAQALLDLAMQLQPQSEFERTRLKTLLTNLALDQLSDPKGVSWLINWHQVALDKSLFREAVIAAVTQLAPDHFSLLVKRAHQFKKSGAGQLSQALVTALDAYWQAEQKNLSG